MLECGRMGMASSVHALFLSVFLGHVNDDGTDNITDPIRLLNHFFIGDGPPPFPGPLERGVDPTEDALAPCVHERWEG